MNTGLAVLPPLFLEPGIIRLGRIPAVSQKPLASTWEALEILNPHRSGRGPKPLTRPSKIDSGYTMI